MAKWNNNNENWFNNPLFLLVFLIFSFFIGNMILSNILIGLEDEIIWGISGLITISIILKFRTRKKNMKFIKVGNMTQTLLFGVFVGLIGMLTTFDFLFLSLGELLRDVLGIFLIFIAIVIMSMSTSMENN